MRWSNVFVIFRREVRDQLRDRRTLFMIFVLPMLLYPILTVGLFKFAEMSAGRSRTVVVVGSEHLPKSSPLLNPGADRFNPELFDTPAEANRLVVRTRTAEGPWLDPKTQEAEMRSGRADAVLTVPGDLVARLDRLESPSTPVVYDSADERSQVTYLLVKEVLERWRSRIISLRLKEKDLPASFTEPIKVKPVDVATPQEVGGSVWAKLFPFLLVMMSLTGAFYPAVDICAGEKERGTMETLLISPATRSEIVLGKFLTVFLASVMTAVLNLLCMGLTGLGIARRFGTLALPSARRLEGFLAPPSLESAFWILLLLIPLAAFFSAVCLSLAVLARSMKEGQYYMTPLYLVCLPLIFITLAPEVELNLFRSLVPITGVALLLRALMQGDYEVATRYFLPVLLPTVAYGAIALRWAIDQFQREDVLFREAERFDLRGWFRHILRDKEPIPTGGEALFCFATMLASAWYLTQYLISGGLESSVAGMLIGQVAFILGPPLALSFLFTSSTRRTLRLRWPEARYLWLAAGLALALNPLVNELRPVVERLFPISKELKDALEQLMKGVPNLATAVVVFAVVPAVCEEFAFRGFILSGLERGNGTRSAVLMSALLFGFMHVLLSLFQQLFNATLLGIVLGYLAVRSRSILPGIVFHLINNTLGVLMGVWLATEAGRRVGAWVYRDPAQGLYHWTFVAAGVVASGFLLRRLMAAPGVKKAAPEPELSETVAHPW